MSSSYVISKTSKMKHERIREYIKHCKIGGIAYKKLAIKKLLYIMGKKTFGKHQYNNGILEITNRNDICVPRCKSNYILIPYKTTFYLIIVVPTYEQFNPIKHITILKSDDTIRLNYKLIDVTDNGLYHLCNLLHDIEHSN